MAKRQTQPEPKSVDTLELNRGSGTQSLRIAIFTHVPPAGWSGGRYHAWMLAHCAALAGHETHIVANNHPVFASEFRYWPDQGVPHHWSTRSFCDGLPPGQFDLVIIIPHRNRNPNFFNSCKLFATDRGAKRILLNFESGNWFNAMAPAKRPLGEWKQWIEFTDQQCLVLSSNKESVRWAEHFYTKYAPNCTHDFWFPAINTPAANLAASVSRNRTITTITRFNDSHKGADQLVEFLPAELSGWTLKVMAGQSPPASFTNMIRKATAARGMSYELIVAPGDREKFEHLAESSIFLFASRFEGFGYPPVEAAYSGVPTVAFDLPVLREVIGNAGVFVEIGNSEQMREAVEAVANGSIAPEVEDYARVRTRMSLSERVNSLDAVLTRYAAAPRVDLHQAMKQLPSPRLFDRIRREGSIHVSGVSVQNCHVHVRGWVESRQKVLDVIIYAPDGSLISTDYWIERADTLKKYPRQFSEDCGFAVCLPAPMKYPAKWPVVLIYESGKRICTSLRVNNGNFGSSNIEIPLIGISEASHDSEMSQLQIRGWAYTKSAPIKSMQFMLDGQLVGTANVDLPRPDVKATRSDCPTTNSGFIVNLKLAQAPETIHIIPHLSDRGCVPVKIKLNVSTRSLFDDGWNPEDDITVQVSGETFSDSDLPLIAIVSHIDPLPAVQGNRAVICQLAQHLRAIGYRVALVVTRKRPLKDSELTEYLDVFDEVYVTHSPPGSHQHQRPRICPADRGHVTVERTLRYLTENRNLVAVAVQYAHMASTTMSLQPSVHRFVFTHDVLHRLSSLGIPLAPFRRCSRSEEISMLQPADTIVAINDVERHILQEMLPQHRVIEVGMACNDIEPCSARSKSTGNVLFVGSGNPMNTEGAKQFIEHSWPLVRDAVPDAQLHIVGSVCSKLNSLQNRSDIVLHGIVEDLSSAYENADVVVNCTTMGTGLKIKCIEAIGYGKALVTTTNGAEGIKGTPGHHYLVEDDWSEFAIQVSRCLVDTAFRDHMGDQARVLVQSEYSVDRIYRDFDNVLSDHCGHAAPPPAPVATKVAGEGASMVVPRSTKA